MENEKEKVVEEIEKVKEDYPHESLQKIEDDRQAFLRFYKKNNSLKILVTVICLVLIVVTCLVLPNVLDDIENVAIKTGTTLGGSILAIVVLAVYSFLSRRNTDKKMKEYFKNYYENANNFVFSDKKFEKAELQDPGKITLEQFSDCGLYKDVIEVGSRGFTEFSYNNIPMAVVDCAGNVKGEKRVYPVFVGKYLFASANYIGKDPIIIYLKGNEKALPPTNVDGISKVVEDVKYDIYSNNKDWKKTLTSEILKLITAIKTDKTLIDVAISIREGRIFVMLGYDDPLMILPLQNKFDSKPMEQYKKNLAQACKLVEAVNK